MLLVPVVLTVAVLVEGLHAHVHVRHDGVENWLEDPSGLDFNYNINPNDPLGVYNWHLSYPDNCAGYQQSPVDIKTSYVRYNPHLQCPVIFCKSGLISGKFKNTGNSIKFHPDYQDAMIVTNAPYRPGKYVIGGVHMHYGGLHGRDGTAQRYPGYLYPGSEHSIDGYRYDGEVHFAFLNSIYDPAEYGPTDYESDGIVVLSIFVQVLPDWSVRDMRVSRYLEEVIPSVLSINQTRKMYLDPSVFLGTSCDFYTYQGGLTTPYCGQSVRFVILRNPVCVTQTAWYLLSRVQTKGNYVSLYGNYRNTQPLNGRIIETNVPPDGYDNNNNNNNGY